MKEIATSVMEPMDMLNRIPMEMQQVLLAFSVVMNRISTLSQEDRNDLTELVCEWTKCSDPGEQRGIHKTMIEILMNQEGRLIPVEETVPKTLSPGLQNWVNHVGTKIKEAREKAGLTQIDLAEKAQLNQSHISRLEKGEHSPNRKTLEKIAAALNLQVRDLDGGEE